MNKDISNLCQNFYGNVYNKTMQNTIQNSLFHNGGHRSVIQNSHNTILMMSGNLEYTFVVNLTKLDIVKILYKFLAHKIAIMVLTPKAPITTSHPLLSPVEIF